MTFFHQIASQNLWHKNPAFSDTVFSDSFNLSSVQPLSSPYQELGTAYSTHDIDQLRGVATKHQQIFQRVSNKVVNWILISVHLLLF